MPFSSEAQRRKFYAMAERGEISKKTLDEWVSATPKGAKLPEHVKHHAKKAFFYGVEEALERFGCKQAAHEELRLQLPKREFHGYDAAWRTAAGKNEKQAMIPSAEELAKFLRAFDNAPDDAKQDPASKRVDRPTMWSGPTTLDSALGGMPNAGNYGGKVF